MGGRTPPTLRPIGVEPDSLFSGNPVMYKNEDFIRLGIRVASGNRYIWLKALKSTAAFYGWDQMFPTLMELKEQTTGSRWMTDPGRRGWKTGGGVRYTICRSSSKQGSPKGLTNDFAMSGQASIRDLARVAKATQVDWHWMTNREGLRISRGTWEKTPTP